MCDSFVDNGDLRVERRSEGFRGWGDPSSGGRVGAIESEAGGDSQHGKAKPGGEGGRSTCVCVPVVLGNGGSLFHMRGRPILCHPLPMHHVCVHVCGLLACLTFGLTGSEELP